MEKIAPLLAEACLRRRIDPVPYLLALACASNIGSAATLIGNPQNMLIGSVMALDFGRYLVSAALPVALSLLLAWGWFVNLSNFMDGADGLATTQALLVLAGVAMLVPPLAPLALVLLAATVGFLRVNGPWVAAPRKVFLGDVGSTWLGFMLGGLLLVGCADDTWRVIWPLATLPLLFCTDATSTLFRRLAQGQNPLVPHKQFWFHRFLALGHSHGQLLAWLVAVNLVLLALALWGYALSLSWGEAWAIIPFGLGLLLCGGAACYVQRQENLAKCQPKTQS